MIPFVCYVCVQDGFLAQYWKEKLTTFGCGACSGILSSAASSPLDVVRIRLAVQKVDTKAVHHSPINIAKRTWRLEGIRGFYCGFGSTLAVVPLFWAVYFSTYEHIRESMIASPMFYSERQSFAKNALIHMSSAVCAGIWTDVLTNPLFVVRTRLQTQFLRQEAGKAPMYKGTFSTLVKIYRTEGIASLYRGLTASILGLSHVMIQFPLYEYLKLEVPRYLRGPDASCLASDFLLSAILSKFVSSTITYPHEVLRARLMFDPTAYSNLFDCVRKTYRAEGFKGFFGGLSVNLFRVVPSCAVTFVSYELFKQYLHVNTADAPPVTDRMAGDNVKTT